ncbi:MAG TPA: FAD-dependent monooxygenase [Saprospiraceae bacterium]|nr:FAD-dependent monooxygenase [Saprospiraceae bacterium]
MATHLTTDVIIIGAGPTGLMAANQLARFGCDFIILDSKKGPTVQSRAIAVTSRSLEIYEQMGLADEVVQNGQRIESFHFFSGGKQRGKVVLGEMGKGLSDFNYLLGYEQSKNEELLYHNLQKQGKEVLWETSFVEITEFEEKVVVVAKSEEQLIIHAKYLIACDGAGSPVRHQLKLAFEGGTYENKFFVADTVLKWQLSYTGLIISPSDQNFVAFFPMKGASNYRVLGTLPDKFSQDDTITFRDIEKTVLETIGIPIQFEKVNWFSIYKLHHRRVDDFRKGNIFLAGDAAHIHSPAGGQGMNTGLQDAYNIAWKLSLVLRGITHEKLLDTYEEERLPFAKWLMSFTDRGFNLMTSDNRVIAFMRKNLASKLIGLFVNISFARRLGFKTVSQIGYSYHNMSLSGSATRQKLKFKSGDRLPYVLDERGKSLYHVFTKPSFYLLHIGSTALKADLIDDTKKTFGLPIDVVENNSAGWINLGVKKELFIWIRPDNYIFFLDDVLDVDKVRHHLKSVLN